MTPEPAARTADVSGCVTSLAIGLLSHATVFLLYSAVDYLTGGLRDEESVRNVVGAMRVGGAVALTTVLVALPGWTVGAIVRDRVDRRSPPVRVGIVGLAVAPFAALVVPLAAIAGARVALVAPPFFLGLITYGAVIGALPSGTRARRELRSSANSATSGDPL